MYIDIGETLLHLRRQIAGKTDDFGHFRRRFDTRQLDNDIDTGNVRVRRNNAVDQQRFTQGDLLPCAGNC